MWQTKQQHKKKSEGKCGVDDSNQPSAIMATLPAAGCEMVRSYLSTPLFRLDLVLVKCNLAEGGFKRWSKSILQKWLLKVGYCWHFQLGDHTSGGIIDDWSHWAAAFWRIDVRRRFLSSLFKPFSLPS